jgi:protein subunit release factor B
MSLQSRAQLENTRAKLKLLEGRLGELEQEPVVNARTRELTRLSLKKLINQLKEEIVRFEARGFGQSVIHSATHQEVTLQEGLPRD